MRVALGSMLFVAMVAAGPASAQHPIVLAKLQEINAGAPQPAVGEIRLAVMETARMVGLAQDNCVPSDVVLTEIAPLTGSRDILQGVLSGQIRNGWWLYAAYGGCPGMEPVRYMIVQNLDKSLFATRLSQGRTYANPSIVRDIGAQAAIAALQKAKSLDAACTGEGMKMRGSRIVAQSNDLGSEVFGVRYVGSWSEGWRFETCGKTFEVIVELTPDGDGGAYSKIKADAVTIVQ